MTQDQSDIGADVTRRHRLKHPGDLNYDAKMTDAMMNTEPNIMRDAFVREEQRRLDRLKYYEGLDRERDKEVKEKRKQDDLQWQRKIVNQDNNIFFEEQERRKVQRDELKKQYAGELRDQYMKSQEAKVNQTGMTALERRINQDNLQAYQSWDPNNYASIPGWGGNAKYYNQLLTRIGAKQPDEPLPGARRSDFASMAANNILNPQG